MKLFSSQVVSSIFGISGGFLAGPTGNSTIYENDGLNPTRVPGIWNVKFGSTVPLSDFDVKATIVNQIRRLSDPTYFPKPPRVLDIVTFSAHTPFELHVRSAEIAQGFYGALHDLQGRNSTYYNGAAFQVHDSSLIWRYSKDTLVPLLLG